MSDERLAFEVSAAEAGRADRVLAGRFPGAGRRQLAALFEAGAVRVDGRRVDKGARLAAGARVELSRAPLVGAERAPVPAPTEPLEVLAVDAAVIALAKPPGIACHPLAAGETGTLANALVARYPECATASADPREGGLAHRLDRGTSGVVLAARDRATWDALRAQFSTGGVLKRYLALTAGHPRGDGSDAWIAQRGARVALVADGTPDGLAAETRWRVVEPLGDDALVECEAESGRMHQIRAHLAGAGAPLHGDPLYGGPAELAGEALPRHFLHAHELALTVRGAARKFVAPPPADFAALLERLRARSRR